jgi:putative chitinase
MTPEDLRRIMPASVGLVASFAEPLTAAMTEWGIATGRRRAAFLAQCAHESGELRYLREIASGVTYEGRTDLGNIVAGDGARFKGGGLLQITGRANYREAGTALGLDLENQPTLIETPIGASRSAAWFWQRHGLNALADADRFGEITKVINGGYSGLDARLRYWLAARAVERLY